MFINSLFSFHVTFCLRFIKRRNIVYQNTANTSSEM